MKVTEADPDWYTASTKNTSGLLVIAKSETPWPHWPKEFFRPDHERKYSALVWGDFKEDEGTIIGNVGRSLKDRKIMDVFPSGEHGKHAVTHYKVVERFGYVTLIECKLETGRTHQIQCTWNLQVIRFSTMKLYGGNRIPKGTTFTTTSNSSTNCFELLPTSTARIKHLDLFIRQTKKKCFWMSFAGRFFQRYRKVEKLREVRKRINFFSLLNSSSFHFQQRNQNCCNLSRHGTKYHALQESVRSDG